MNIESKVKAHAVKKLDVKKTTKTDHFIVADMTPTGWKLWSIYSDADDAFSKRQSLKSILRQSWGDGWTFLHMERCMEDLVSIMEEMRIEWERFSAGHTQNSPVSEISDALLLAKYKQLEGAERTDFFKVHACRLLKAHQNQMASSRITVNGKN